MLRVGRCCACVLKPFCSGEEMKHIVEGFVTRRRSVNAYMWYRHMMLCTVM